MIQKANIGTKSAIVATHVLEPMTEEVVSTCAEVSDVVYAVLDRGDVVMLSDETVARMGTPEAVAMMNKIIRLSEQELLDIDLLSVTSPRRIIVEAVGNLTCDAVYLLPNNINAIIVATRSG